jgi:hypothetical protein
MSNEIYTPFSLEAIASHPVSENPLRAGDLLPELLRRYRERVAVAELEALARPEEANREKSGISIAIVNTAGRTVVPSYVSEEIESLTLS